MPLSIETQEFIPLIAGAHVLCDEAERASALEQGRRAERSRERLVLQSPACSLRHGKQSCRLGRVGLARIVQTGRLARPSRHASFRPKASACKLCARTTGLGALGVRAGRLLAVDRVELLLRDLPVARHVWMVDVAEFVLTVHEPAQLVAA